MTDDCRADTSTQGRGAVGGTESVNAEGATLACSLVGDSDSFDIDTTSGELFYRGSGEDYESGTTRFTLTVRASDGSETADTTVTVNVTDVDETVDPPMIRVADAEATEGDDSAIVFRVTLESTSSGTVTVNYATADGTATAGEDYTATSGTLTFAPGETEKTVSVAIIDDEVEDSGEAFRLVLGSPTNAVLADSEATGTIHTEAMDDYPADTATTGMVAVGGTATGEIDRAGDRDWFAVTLEAGTRYRVDLKGSRTADDTLDDPYLRGIHDVDGNLIHGTGDDDGGYLHNSLVYYTPDAGGTYYISAGGYGRETGTYELSVAEETL